MLEEVLIAFGRRAEQVGPPDRQDAREVLGRIRILTREAQRAGLELIDHMLGYRTSRRLGLVGEVVWVAVEGRVRRHPAEPGAERDQVRGGLPGELTLSGRRRQRVRAELVV